MDGPEFHRIGLVGIVMERGGRENRVHVAGCGDVEDVVLWVVVRKEVRGFDWGWGAPS